MGFSHMHTGRGYRLSFLTLRGASTLMGLAALVVITGCNPPASFSTQPANSLSSTRGSGPIDGTFLPPGGGGGQPPSVTPCDDEAECEEISFAFNPRFNPYLAGMPVGTISKAAIGEDDVAGEYNFVALQGGLVQAGRRLQFVVSGHTNNTVNPQSSFGPDGFPTVIFDRLNYYKTLSPIPSPLPEHENGIRFAAIPANSFVAVFLGEEAPNQSTPPSVDDADCPTDYSSAAARNRAEYRPQLKQLFFIGDGKASDGTAQTFVVPVGAKRLYFANMDQWEWNNNWGTFAIDVKSRY